MTLVNLWTSCLEANIKIKTEYSFISIQKRLLSFMMLVAFIFLTIFVRLFYLQSVASYNMQVKAMGQWVRSLPLTAKRGMILDSCGNVLALSQTSYDVYVRAREVEDSAKTAMYLSTLLGLNYDSVYMRVKDTTTSESLIKLQIDSATAQKLNNSPYKGIYTTENISRIYPYKASLAQTIGYLTSDSIGQSGVESFYNNILSGTNGKYLTQSDVRGITLNNSLQYYIEPEDGLDISLNIDINIQRIVEEALSHIMLDHEPKSAQIVVMDPSTSKILAMALSPSFDLNNVPRDDVKQLMSLSKNSIVTDVYEPGSTFKILTLAAALSEGLTSIDEHFYCPGYRIVDGQRIKCWKTTGHGSQTLVECVQNSCNCCFMDLGLRLGKERLYKYLTAFGIGSQTGVDISGESGGLLLDINSVKNVDLARIAFGQTVAVSQLQLLNSFCSIINGGTSHTPQLLSHVSQNSEVIYEKKSLSQAVTLKSEVSGTINYLLEQSLSKTGEMTFVNGFKICGKTGTAQTYDESGSIASGKYISSFFGYMYSGEVPKYALLICVKEPSNGAYYGSIVAKPYGAEIFRGIIDYLSLEKDDDTIPDERITVENYVGLSISDAVAKLDKLGINYEVAGEGLYVLSQFPHAGENISKSSTICINCEENLT